MTKHLNRKLPEYYPTMYLDGYTPEEIYIAFHNSLSKKSAPKDDINKIKITSEVKIKK